MKLLGPALILALSCLGATASENFDQTPPGGIAPSTEANKGIVRGYIEQVINEEDWSAWPDFFGDTISFNGQTMSIDDVKAMTTAFRSILADYHITIEGQIAEGDTVATRVSISGTHHGDYMGIEATGKHVTFRGLTYDRIVDGKVVEMWHEMDIWGTLLMLEPAADTDVEVTILASRSAIRAGERVELTITAINRGTETVWTNPSVICTGSWDYIVRDANGERVRVDDRDMMRCPSGGLLTTPIAPGTSTSLTVGWDGRVRTRVTEAPRDAPRGTYEIEATVRWADRENTANLPGPPTFTGSARTSIEVASEIPPPEPPPEADAGQSFPARN